MAEACRALDLPVIGGNVSLYNESGGADIDPTPVLGVLGLVDAVHAPPARAGLVGGRHRRAGRRPGGRRRDPSRWTGTRWATERRDHRTGRVPPVDFAAHAAACAFVAGAGRRAGGRRDDGAAGARRARRVRRRPGRRAGRDGGRGGDRAARVDAVDDAAELFTELPSRFVVATARSRRRCAPGRRPLGVPSRRARAAPAATASRWGRWSTCPWTALCRGPRGEPRSRPGRTVMAQACARMGGDA